MNFCVIGDNGIAIDLVEFLLTQDNEIYWLTDKPLPDRVSGKKLHILPFCYGQLENLGSVDYCLLVGDNDEENILRASVCKERLGSRVLVLIQNHDLARTDLLQLFPYIDEYLYPGENIGDQIVHFAVEENGLPQRRFLHPNLNIWTYTLEEDHPLLGKALKDLTLKETLVVAIYREGNFFIPKGDSLLKAGDRLYLLGSESAEIFERGNFFLNQIGQRKKFWILGDSIHARNLGLCLEEEGFDVDLSIPCREDLEAWRLDLPKIYVKQEDLTSLKTFTDVDPMDYKGVICASKNDDENVLMSILASKAGFQKSFCLIDHKDHAKATETLVTGLQLSPSVLAASSLFTMVHQPGKIHITPLPGGTTELLELDILEDSPIIGKELKDLCLADMILVGAVLRKRQLIIPSGSFIFREEDRLIIFSDRSLRDQLLKKLYHKDQTSKLKKWIGGQQ